MRDDGPGHTEPSRDDEAGQTALRPGATFAGLEIEAEIGRGGMGVIYRARDPGLERVRALKVLPHDRSVDPEFRERFRRESRLAASIEHPNVTPVYRAGEEGGWLYLVMRFVDGPSLQAVLADQGRLPPRRAAALARQVGAALDAAHAQGLIHRDVKPGNILLEGKPGRERAFLCDFGISKRVDADTHLTTTGHLLGTVDYMAPEQIAGGPVDHRADVYSLACVLHHALTGSPPFSRDTPLATMFAHANAPRPRASQSAPELSREVDRVLARGMAPAAEDRFDSAGEFAAQLARAVGGEDLGAAPTTRLAATPARQRRAGWALLAAGAVVAGLAAAAIFAIGGAGSETSVQTIGLPRPAVGITVGPQRVWAASPSDRSVSSIVPGEGHVASTAVVGGYPVSVAVGFNFLWVVDADRDQVLRARPRTGVVLERIPVGRHPSDVAVDRRWVWVTDRGSGSVSRVDPRTSEVTATVRVGSEPNAIATGPAGVWVTDLGDGSVARIDPATAKVVGEPIQVGQRPNDIAVGGSAVWVTDKLSDAVVRIDPDAMAVTGEVIAVGDGPRGVALGLGYVWVANGGDGTLSQIDPDTREVVDGPIAVGARPGDLVTTDDSVWTANGGDSTLSQVTPH